MRKHLKLALFTLVLACMLIATMPVIALASDDYPVDGGSFFTWPAIGTFAGAVALVVFLVQLLKLPIDKVWHIPTQYIVYVVSLVVLLLAQLFVPTLGGLTWDTGFLCVFNAALVALTAMATYTKMIEEPERVKLLGDIKTISEGMYVTGTDEQTSAPDVANG